MKLTFTAPLLLALGFVSACSDSDEDSSETTCTSPNADGVRVTPIALSYDLACPLDGFPFVQSINAASIRDATVSVTRPRAGTLCLSGAGSSSSMDPSFGVLVLVLSTRNPDQTQVFSALDLDMRGITQLAFTLESPPSPGLLIEATSITSLSCPGNRTECATPVPGFALMTGPGSSTRLSITSEGRVVVPFANFEQANPVSGSFDTTALDHIAFHGSGGAFDFCLSDVEFLDASGKPVRP